MQSSEVDQSTIHAAENTLLSVAPAALSIEVLADEIGTNQTQAKTILSAVDQEGGRVRVDSIDAMGGHIWFVEEAP